MAVDYKSKIRKLLALAESSNENEARGGHAAGSGTDGEAQAHRG